MDLHTIIGIGGISGIGLLGIGLIVGTALEFVLCFLVPHRFLRRMASDEYDPKATDPPLLVRYSSIKSYQTTRATYPGIRVFFRRHLQSDQLPTDPAPIPLLVFVHGLGGSVAQFNCLLTSLSQVASCLAIDLPGCGVSDFSVRDWSAYTTDALVELLETVIEDHREKDKAQGVVLIGHSMGASLCALLAAPRSKPRSDLSNYVMGLVGICPAVQPPSADQARWFRLFLRVPDLFFNLYRAWDRRGGTESPSVLRFTGPNADAETKRLQNLYNWQSRTPVFRRMAWGLLPEWRNGKPSGGLASEETWSSLDVPVFVVTGADDHICPPSQVEKVVRLMGSDRSSSRADSVASEISTSSDDMPVNGKSPNGTTSDTQALATNGKATNDTASLASHGPSADGKLHPEPCIPPLPLHPEKTVKSVILPAPANHTLPYAPATAHTLAGLISDFLTSKITGRLSQGWQLQYLSREGKWDVKNLEKWKSVAPVSDPIGGVFRAIKTLREVDETHSPRCFVERWGETIKDVIDISHDNPVYDPQGLSKGGIKYHKYPTVSKMPPSDADIEGFIELVDKIRATQKEKYGENKVVIGVHCHYGFNRTGFLIVCYLVERCGYTAKQAIDHFAEARPNGIKHEHFRDRLFLRYSGVKTEEN